MSRSSFSAEEVVCLSALAIITLLALVGAGTVVWWIHWLWSSYSLVRAP